MQRLVVGVALGAIAVAVALAAANRGPAKTLLCHVIGINCPKWRFVGHVQPGWEAVMETVEVVFDQGYELGSQLTVMHKGETVIDVAFGYEDHSYSKAYDTDRLQLVFSTTKFATSLVIAKAMEQGVFKLDDPIAKHWPGFAQGGKGSVTIGDLLSHAGGLHSVSEPMSLEVLLNGGSELRELLSRTQLDNRTWRQAGGQSYHGLSRGFYLNAILEQTDGRSVEEFLHQEILQPMGIPASEFSIGVSAHDTGIVDRLGKFNLMPIDKLLLGFLPRLFLPRWLWQDVLKDVSVSDDEILMYRNIATPGTIPHATFNLYKDGPTDLGGYQTFSEWYVIHSPSSSGVTNAKTAARLAALVAHDGVDPVTSMRILESNTVDLAWDLHEELFEPLFNRPLAYSKLGMGDWVPLVQRPAFLQAKTIDYDAARGECIGWGGAGGSLIQGCRESQLVVGYTTNLYQPHIADWRAVAYMVKALQVARQL